MTLKGLSRPSRILGGLLALHSGDCLGAPYEFESHASLRARYPNGAFFPRGLTGGGTLDWAPGAATDDTDLTRAVLLAYHDIITEDKDPDADLVTEVAEAFLRWFVGDWPNRENGSRPRDVGTRTMRALERYSANRDTQTSGEVQGGGAGNGSLMRCLPTGLFRQDTKLLSEESQRISAITHNDPRCTVSCAVYNSIVAAMLRDTCPKDAVEDAIKVAATLEGPCGPVYEAIGLGQRVSLATIADQGPKTHGFVDECAGFVLDSLALAVAAVLDKRTLEDILVDIVRIGKDTDTNAAIAGGLVGVRDGVEAVPEEWVEMLQFGAEFGQIVDDILVAQEA